MARPLDMHRMMTRRTMILGGIQAAAGVGLLSRLYYLQFIKGAEFATLAEDNRIKVQLLVPPRGLILDRTGIAMAMNQVNFRLMLNTDSRKQARATLGLLTDLMQLRPGEVKLADDAITHAHGGFPVLVREHLAWEEMARMEYHTPDLPGAFIEEGQWRHYPFADHSAHLTGYVGKVDEDEIDDDQPLLAQPDMRVGKNGVEALFDEDLRGVAGTRQIEVNVVGAQVRELAKTPPQQAPDLKLTIDSRLQEYCIERLGVESGAIAVMEAHTGNVLALVSMPGFDPNEFSKGIKEGYWKSLMENERNPLLNKSISGLYPPGSTFKMMTGLAGLRSGKFSAEHRVFCPGYFAMGNKRWGCWKVQGHGSVNMAEALEQSCDTYFYTVGHEIGIEPLAEMVKEFGLGEITGLGLKGEKGGIVPSPEWKEKARQLPWNPGETINTSIGQGDVLATPLQLAVMMARLVNGGKKIHPRLVNEEAVKSDGFIDIPKEDFDVIMDGMTRVINSPRGTAHATEIKEEGKRFGGKTGTAQVHHLTMHGQDQNALPWHLRHHAWFVAFAPVGDPKYVACILVEHGGGGASTAAPIARDIMLKTQELMA